MLKEEEEEEVQSDNNKKDETQAVSHRRKLQTLNDYCGSCAGGTTYLSQYDCAGYYTCLFGEVGPYRECGPGTVFDPSINNCNFDYATPECGCDIESPDSFASLNEAAPASEPEEQDPYYSVSYVKIWREKRVIRSPHQQDLELC
jgi:hypothetical protein